MKKRTANERAKSNGGIPVPIKIAYGVVWVSLASALAQFLPIGDMHEALLGASILAVIICMVLGLQVQPREMRPALFAFLSVWIHAGCIILSRHVGWGIHG
jgi:hypothetical protein